MKDTAIISFLIFILLFASVQIAFCQHGRNRSSNSIALWTNAGYSSIINYSPVTRAVGGLGNAIGVGYEYRARNGFLLQTGFELSLYNSLMRRNDTLHIVPMIDTEGRAFDGLFSFENINSRQRLVNTGPTLMLGARLQNNFYFLVGGKVKFNIHGRERTNSDVTKRARYDNIIGDDHDGILSNMPSHGLKTSQRSHDGLLKMNTLFIGSVEIGHVFSTGNPRNPRSTRMRLSVFCDYGFSPISRSETNYDLIINKSHTSEYTPQITGFLHHDVQSRFFSTLFTGLRLTILFDIRPNRHPCPWLR
ncbi:MAG: hypothetical protein FWD02_04550 [Bacteroidales bacterium]|nr:hypothetical protein [Bacteroidales bacterium]